MVLLGAAAILQQDRCPPVSHTPRIPAFGAWHHQSPPRRRAPPRLRGSDCGLLSPDPAAGIRRVKGVKKIGVRLGNWLTPEQSERLWNTPDCQLLKGKRDRALLAVLLACGLRRHEAVRLDFGHVQQREDHAQIPLGRLNGDMPEKKLNLLQTIVDWKGKAGHIRTVPMPGWVK